MNVVVKNVVDDVIIGVEVINTEGGVALEPLLERCFDIVVHLWGRRSVLVVGCERRLDFIVPNVPSC